jgi:hypothetical protein
VNFICAGRALLLDLGQGPHLWFVLTDLDANGLVVVVMLVTARGHTDKTVALTVGDHPFIDHESNVNYASATLKPAKVLNAMLAKGTGRLHEDMSSAVLHAVSCGLLTSSRTANYLIAHCSPLFGHLCP